MSQLLPTMKKRHFGGGAKPENWVCVRKPQNAVYCIDKERGIHEHAGGVFGFFHCEGELVRHWPKTPVERVPQSSYSPPPIPSHNGQTGSAHR